MNHGPIFSTIRDLQPPSSSGTSGPDIFNIANLSNPLNLSFFGTSDHYSNIQSDWERIERTVSENATGALSSATPSTDLSRAGLGFESELLPSIEIAEGAVEATEVAADSSAGPMGLALMVNQQIGNALTSGMASSQQVQSNSDYVHNMQQHGLNVGLDASLIMQNQQSTIRNQETAGTIGSLFGPIGALIGHSIAGVVSANPDLLTNSGSFQGAVNASDSNIVASQTTQSLAGDSTLVDNVTNGP